jgi:transcriptional regulator with XRE-family HTH domain
MRDPRTKHHRAALDTLEFLPAVVRGERLRRGLSLRDAGEQIGYAFADLHRFEKGRKDVRVSTAMAMLRWVDGPDE